MKSDDLKAPDLERTKARQRLINAYQRAFSTDEGRIVLEDLEQRFGLAAAVFVPVKKENYHAYDPLTAALTDGARRVVIHIRAFLALPPKGDGNITGPKTIVTR